MMRRDTSRNWEDQLVAIFGNDTPQASFWPQQFIPFHIQNTNHCTPWNAIESLSWKDHCSGPACTILLLWKHGLKRLFICPNEHSKHTVSRQGWDDHGHLYSKGKERRTHQPLVSGEVRSSKAHILSFTTLEARVCSRILLWPFCFFICILFVCFETGTF